MATIYYCKICEDLIVDEDELPIVGDYCSRKCEKLFDKYGLQGGKKEYKKKGSNNSQVVADVPVKNLPSESIPESTESTKLNKKKPIDDKNIVFKNINSFFTRIDKDKDKNSNKQRDYDDSLEYFRKQSEIEHSMRDVPVRDNSTVPNNTVNKPKEQLNIPSSSRVENHGMEIPPPHVDDQRTPTPTLPPRVNDRRTPTPTPPPLVDDRRTPTPTPPPLVDDRRTPTPTSTPPSRLDDRRTPTPTSTPPPHVDDQRLPTPPPVESQTTSPSLYPELKQNRPPLEDFDSLSINDDVNEPPPPAYETLYPNTPPQTVKVEKPLPLEPTENKPIITDQKKPIVTDQKKPIVTDQKKPIVTDKKDPVTTDKKETTTNTTSTPPLIPPKVPPKVSIPTANRDSIPPQPQTRPYSNYPNQFIPNNFSSDSDSYQQYHQFQQFQLRQFQQPPQLQQYQQYQQSQGNTADTFLQEQAFLPSTVYPPPFYTTRFNKNNNA